MGKLRGFWDEGGKCMSGVGLSGVGY